MKFFGLGLIRVLDPGCIKLDPHYLPRTLNSGELSFQSGIEGNNPLPKISVVVPSYNQAQYLEQTLLSILDQQYPALELIVVDGGSTDGSVKIIEKHESRLAFWVSEPDKGQANAINKGMQHATGDILAWLNSDDCYTPNALFEVARNFVKYPNVEVIYGHRILIDDKGRDIGRWLLPPHQNFILSYADFVPQETMFWRRSLWLKSGATIDESYHFALDWDLITRFIDQDARFYRVPSYLGMFRVHPSQKTQADIVDHGWREMEIIKSRFMAKATRNKYQYMLLRLTQKMALRAYLLQARLIELMANCGFKMTTNS